MHAAMAVTSFHRSSRKALFDRLRRDPEGLYAEELVSLQRGLPAVGQLMRALTAGWCLDRKGAFGAAVAALVMEAPPPFSADERDALAIGKLPTHRLVPVGLAVEWTFLLPARLPDPDVQAELKNVLWHVIVAYRSETKPRLP